VCCSDAITKYRHMQVFKCMHPHARHRTRICTHKYAHTHKHAHVHVYTHIVCVRTHTPPLTLNVLQHPATHCNICCSCMHTQPSASSRHKKLTTDTDTDTETDTDTDTDTHTHRHTRTDTHAHTHTHVYTSDQTQKQIWTKSK